MCIAGAGVTVLSWIVPDPFRELTTTERRAVEREREALEAFHG